MVNLVFLSTVSSLAAVRLTNWNPFFKFQPTAYSEQKRDYTKKQNIIWAQRMDV